MIPTLDELGSDPLVHRASDLFNPPALTNFRGGVQAAIDPVGLWNLNFPPLACGELPSGLLYLDGRLFAASGEPVTFRWFPDRIERSAAWRGLQVASTTVLAWAAEAALVRFSVRNVSGTERRVRVGLGLQGNVARSLEPWHSAVAPAETPGHGPADGMVHAPGSLGTESRSVDAARGALVVVAPSGATSVEGLVRKPGDETAVDVDGRGAWVDVGLRPGATWQATYVRSAGVDRGAALELFDRLAGDVDAELARVRAEWQAEIQAVFTPGNDRYSGSLPILESTDADLRRIYHMGMLGVVYFKRESPHSVVGRAYDTLMPRYWATTTFIWDYSLSSLVHALLDPAEMQGQLERWMRLDPHTCYGSDWMTGKPLGVWYAVNDHAMTQSIDQYVRWTGELDWLDTTVETPDGHASVREQLTRYATGWRRIASPNGLADYGGINNLLECVSSYVHEVAAMNLANVWNLRVASDYIGRADRTAGDALRAEAEELSGRVWKLYQEGAGWFNARMPDGRLLPVRHCYDLIQALNLVPGDIDDRRRSEIVQFFERELQTPNWMRALSPDDPDAISSVRPDHQWNGAYTAWPAWIASGLYEIGREELASTWLRGLAASMNQGPVAQAHFVDEFIAGDNGGALKASSEWPYINDWACSSGGAWARLIIEGVFGVRATVDGLTATPRLERLHPGARLVGLRYQGRLHDVDRAGVREAGT